jgi:hypothetical protein
MCKIFKSIIGIIIVIYNDKNNINERYSIMSFIKIYLKNYGSLFKKYDIFKEY